MCILKLSLLILKRGALAITFLFLKVVFFFRSFLYIYISGSLVDDFRDGFRCFTHLSAFYKRTSSHKTENCYVFFVSSFEKRIFSGVFCICMYQVYILSIYKSMLYVFVRIVLNTSSIMNLSNLPTSNSEV